MFYLSLLISTLVSFATVAEQEVQKFSDAELAQMLAPIALYPDSLLTHILIASTYPIEIVEAHRWLKKNENFNENLNSEQKEQLLKTVNWDASVKVLIPFERVLSRLSEDLSWTQNLGDAFLQDESRVLLSIQTLRKQAKLAGNLKKMDNMDIRYENNNILILPREKNVIYVPYYDSRTVYGLWHWAAYPPVYWHSYHRAHISHYRHIYRPFYWHTGVHITFNYFFSAFHWHNRYVVVVNPQYSRYYRQRPRHLIANGGYAKRWSHQASHRKGVAYLTKKTSKKYYSNRIGVHRTNSKLNEKLNEKLNRKLNTKLNKSQRKFKQSLHSANHSSHKVKYDVKHTVRHNKGQPSLVTKQFTSHHKPHNTSVHHYKRNKESHKQNKQSRRINKHLRKVKSSK